MPLTNTQKRLLGEHLHEEIEAAIRKGKPFDTETASIEPGKFFSGRVDYESLELRAAAESILSRSPLAKRKRGRGQGARRRRKRDARGKRRWAQMSPAQRLRAAWFAAFPEAARWSAAMQVMRERGVTAFGKPLTTGRTSIHDYEGLHRNPGRKP